LESLLAALHDSSAYTRTREARDLGDLADTRAIDALSQGLSDPDDQVRFFSGEAARKVRGQ
jgi:HEAT repeat protein